MRVAIVDMGTNTFNLLIAETNGDFNFHIIHNSKCAVKLGEGGITRKFITPEAWSRGLAAIETHMATISSFNVDKAFAFATSATRDAENGAEFVDEILKKHKLKVNVIGGNQEAKYIYQGVRQAIDLGDDPNLILDIGGGSNEIIIGNAKQSFWMHSFNLGVQRLLTQFNPNDPITPNEVISIENFLDVELKSMLDAASKYIPKRMVGSSGSFDTFRSVLSFAGAIPITDSIYAEIPMDRFFDLHQQFLKSTRDERMAMQGMNPIRVDFIVLSSIFTNFIVKRLDIKSMFQSEYALKEGALWELLTSYRNS